MTHYDLADHRHRLGQLHRRRGVRRPEGRDPGEGHVRRHLPQRRAASRPRCSSTPPTSPPRRTPTALGVDTRLDGVRWRGDPRPDLPPDRPDLRRRPRAGGRSGRSTSRSSRATPGSPAYRTLDTGHRRDDHRRPGGGRRRRRAVVPDDPRASTRSTLHTSDTVMRIDDAPRPARDHRRRLRRRGVRAHVLLVRQPRSPSSTGPSALLRAEDAEVPRRFTELAQRALGRPARHQVTRRSRRTTGASGCTCARRRDHGATRTLCSSPPAGPSNADGSTCTAPAWRSTTPGSSSSTSTSAPPRAAIWALGDISNRYQLKHVSNQEARVVRHNLLHPDDLLRADHDARAQRGLQPPAGGQRRHDRGGGAASAASATSSAAHGLRRHRLRLGDGGPRELREGARRPRHRAAARRAHDRRAGVEPDPAADPGDELRPDRRRRRARAVLDPSRRSARSSRTRCSEPPKPPLHPRRAGEPPRPSGPDQHRGHLVELGVQVVAVGDDAGVPGRSRGPSASPRARRGCCRTTAPAPSATGTAGRGTCAERAASGPIGPAMPVGQDRGREAHVARQRVADRRAHRLHDPGAAAPPHLRDVGVVHVAGQERHRVRAPARARRTPPTAPSPRPAGSPLERRPVLEVDDLADAARRPGPRTGPRRRWRPPRSRPRGGAGPAEQERQRGADQQVP